MSTSVARVRSRLILALFEGGMGVREVTSAYAEAWVNVLSRSPDGSKCGGTVRSMSSGWVCLLLPQSLLSNTETSLANSLDLTEV